MLNNQDTQSTGRYSIGEKIYGISFLYEYQSGKNNGYRSPFGYDGYHKPYQIDIVDLIVTEHHKVHSQSDAECKKDYDGYKLKDNKDRIWLNQYPIASPIYGQMMDTGNRMFKLEISSDQEIKKLFDKNEPWEVFLVTSYYQATVSNFEYMSKPENRAMTNDFVLYDSWLQSSKQLITAIENKMKELGLMFVEKQISNECIITYELKPI
jgi:hypothetical protein